MDDSFGPLTHLGRYQILRQLGRGSMGVVYEALDPRLDRSVAIKTIIKGHLLDTALAAEYTLRFQREAQAVGRLTHPHIVTLYDFGEESDVTYIVMEFIRGRELASHFEAGEVFDLPAVVRIMGELLDALAYAHEHGIVHRDIKPANVMLDEQGRVKLTDFGVARVTDSNLDRTQPGTLVGTPSYMSPEQILGMAVGSRADLFAAGVILYQFLVQEKPFKGNGPWEVQRSIVNDRPVPPSLAKPGVPKPFDAIIAKALAKEPEQRYRDAGSFADDLRAALATVRQPQPEVDLPLDLANEVDESTRVEAARPPSLVRHERRPGTAGPTPMAPIEIKAGPMDATVVKPAAAPLRAPAPGVRAPVEPPPVAAPRTEAATRPMAAWWAGGALVLAAAATGWWLWSHQPAKTSLPAVTPVSRQAEPRASEPAAMPARLPASAPPSAPPLAPPSAPAPEPVAVPAAPAVALVPAAPASRPLPPSSASAPSSPPGPQAIPHSSDGAAQQPMDRRPIVRQNAPQSVRRVPDESAVAPPVRRGSNPRCADLLQRAQLGETLSPESLEFLRKECRS